MRKLGRPDAAELVGLNESKGQLAELCITKPITKERLCGNKVT